MAAGHQDAVGDGLLEHEFLVDDCDQEYYHECVTGFVEDAENLRCQGVALADW